MRTRQDVTGLPLTIFGTGSLTHWEKPWPGRYFCRIRAFAQAQPLKPDLSAIADVPVVGPVMEFISAAFIQHNLFIYLSLLVAKLVYWYLFHTRLGLHVRSTGENPSAVMLPVSESRRFAISMYLWWYALWFRRFLYIGYNVGTWLDDIIAGRGWIVLHWSSSSLASNQSNRRLALFGAWDRRIQTSSGAGNCSLPIFSQYFIDLYPYLMTIIVLVITYARKKAWQGPASLGQPYFREDR
jgi:simple sugar transport system permease protein